MRVGVIAVLMAALAAPVAAKVPLRDVARIDDGLMYLAIADQLRKDCGGIGARMLRALSYIDGLKKEAAALGYTKDEVDDYVTSKSEKRRMKSKATAWLQARGVSVNDKTSFCAFGQAEIAKGSRIGALLRER